MHFEFPALILSLALSAPAFSCTLDYNIFFFAPLSHHNNNITAWSKCFEQTRACLILLAFLALRGGFSSFFPWPEHSRVL